MRQTVTLTAAGSSKPIRVSPNDKQFNIGALISFVGGTGAGTDIEYTFSRPDMSLGVQDNWANAVWYKEADLTALTTDEVYKIDTPVEALRLTAATVTNAASLSVIQGYKGT